MLDHFWVAMDFIPQQWLVETSKDGGQRTVTLLWHRKPGEADFDPPPTWSVDADKAALDEDDRVFALGSAAYSLEHIQDDVDGGDASANTTYLRDNDNLDFVSTPHGKLGDLLSAAQCNVVAPTNVIGVADGMIDGQKGFVHLQISVDCPSAVVSPMQPDAMYRHGGALIAANLPDGSSHWMPTSFFALRIWNRKPAQWAGFKLPLEDQVIVASKVAATYAKTSGYNWLDVARVIELRNSGRPLPDSLEASRALETAEFLLRLEIATSGKATPAIVEQFLLHEGILATTLSDDGIMDMMMASGSL